ncbi:hypothetical protein TREMEDRAFT_65007 [Tremella mesenterica DSM 1558]|uniref:uncharacterized protein n=1 Tax=Tremella mesenterica (strain ATCC 24925 / CBS 8224 / DSM 1558 / NBRC 9311 / NRRL Y-6157 / RJB 2259-6 / UBC 559-6) TaxID=578456 RepID=UPI0003F49973|nr:uncharacterized protein TREMEDRAFT_65007 [Tremella mesenterica DSM 1558]EIW67138.1 hypothetical protein TREMEDRAFT_65007 [Tremella mesenterica DSM 1558]
MVAEIAGYDEAAATALFASQAQFLLACQFASLVLETLFAGILAMQVYTYFKYQWNDKLSTKILVAWVAIMNLVVSIYYWVYISYLFVENYGKWLPWLEVRWLALMPLFDVLAVAPVQLFFSHRAFLLSKRSWPLLVLFICLIIAAAIGGLGVTVVFGSQASLLDANKSGAWLIIWNACNCACDVIIAFVIMVTLLRSKSGWSHTDRVITKWVRLTFEAQLPPTFLSLAYVIEWSRTPSSLLGALFQCLEGKAYAVGLLFSLNARVAMQTQAEKPTNPSYQTPQVFGHSRTAGPAEIHVEVETQTYVQGEPVHQRKDDSSIEEGDQYQMSNLAYGSQARLTDGEKV